MRNYLLFLPLFMFMVSCTPKAAVGDSMARVLKFEEKVSLKPGETAMVDNQTGSVTFVEVMNDSRCPEGVDCIQAGEATVVVELANGQRQKVLVGANYRTAKRIVSGGIVVNVLGLTPYPKDGKPFGPEEYRLQISTSPLKG